MDNQEREGGDITAADMVIHEDGPSEVEEFYADQTIFITGATGFLGTVFVEKLLRTCSRLRRMYILVREKKGKDIQTRFDEIFEGPCFDNLKRNRPSFVDQVKLVNGDCRDPNLGLSDKDLQTLIQEVTCIIHCAATVRFDQHIRTAANINVRTTKDLLRMAKQMKQLKTFIYVSTAYSNCPRKDIEELFYDPIMTGDQLMKLTEALDDEKLLAITSTVIGDYPNTYVFTKAVAEDVVRKEAENLPLCIVRPCIVVASVKEPVAGWINNVYGATGVLVGAALGILRSLPGKASNLAEMIPVDYVVNCSLAAGWEIGSLRSVNNNEQSPTKEEKFLNEIPIYNIVSSPESPLDWYDFTKYSEKHLRNVPSEKQIWTYCFALRANRIHHLLAAFFLQTVPAYIVDFLGMCIGKNPGLVQIYKKIDKFSEVIGYFSLREWKYTNENVQALWKKLSRSDKIKFEFSMANFNWDEYFITYSKGIRVYLVKDPLDTIAKGRKTYYKLLFAHYTLIAVLLLIFFKMLCMLFNYLF